MNPEQVLQEIGSALDTFTADGYAESIGFRSTEDPSVAYAEVYGEEGAIVTEYKITFTITEESN